MSKDEPTPATKRDESRRIIADLAAQINDLPRHSGMEAPTRNGWVRTNDVLTCTRRIIVGDLTGVDEFEMTDEKRELYEVLRIADLAEAIKGVVEPGEPFDESDVSFYYAAAEAALREMDARRDAPDE